MVGQAVLGALASGDGNDSTDYQVVLGVANVHVDVDLLLKDTCGMVLSPRTALIHASTVCAPGHEAFACAVLQLRTQKRRTVTP